jgi:GDPmannose 4,6-dehydratase
MMNNQWLKTAIITGIDGQDGPYLAQLLLDKGYKVFGVTRQSTKDSLANLKAMGLLDKVEVVECDICDEAFMARLIARIRPTEFYNLAAQSFVGSSWDLARVTTQINANAVLGILQAIQNHSPSTRFYQASTSEMFGNSSDRQDETTQFAPESPYAAAKLHAYWTAKIFRKSHGLHASNGILFNHESPIRGPQFVTRKITMGIANIIKGNADFLQLGNLDAKRDWGFAGDYVEAMWLMTQREVSDDYVIATGQAHSIREFLNIAFAELGVTNWGPYVQSNPDFYRPSDVNVLHGDATKAKNLLGWEPKTSFEDLVVMMVQADLRESKCNVKEIKNRLSAVA